MDTYTHKSEGLRRLLSIAVLMIVTVVLSVGQTPDPSPSPDDDQLYNGYRMSANTEIGFRWRSVDGNDNKFRSDLNYKQGLRVFDSSILLQAENGKGRYFDSMLIKNSGWGSDPTGMSMVNVEKTGIYKFKSTVRRITYFNSLANHVNPTGAFSQHTNNTRHYLGDFDLSVFPQNERLRLTFGTSFSDLAGLGTTTMRFAGDEFQVNNQTDHNARDFRVGAEGKLLGFTWGITQGLRTFDDRSYLESGADLGNNPTNNAGITSFTRYFPTDGRGYFTNFHVNRTFADRLDFTGRVIYGDTTSVSSLHEKIVGRDNSNNFVDDDFVAVSGDTRRLQTRADIGLTFRITDDLRVSNTTTLDQFSISGDETFQEIIARRSSAGVVNSPNPVASIAYRATRYRRLVNTIEADYQFGRWAGFHIGYRYTNREISTGLRDQTLTSPPSGTNPALGVHEESNTTNSVIAGMRIKPTRNWSIFWSVDHGTADNVFTRLENYEYTNFKVRSRWSYKKIVLSLIAITKDNTNPSFSIVPLTNENFVTEITSRSFGGNIDYMPSSNLSFNAGYNYRGLDSYTPILIPLGGPLTRGSSQFFVKDHYFNFDISAKAGRRASIFASYRISRDAGQDIFSTAPQEIITSYPMNFQSPEVRVAFRITRNVDWNVGYQYYRYQDKFTPIQNYRAHLPFTSLRIYFGRGAQDR